MSKKLIHSFKKLKNIIQFLQIIIKTRNPVNSWQYNLTHTHIETTPWYTTPKKSLNGRRKNETRHLDTPEMWLVYQEPPQRIWCISDISAATVAAPTHNVSGRRLQSTMLWRFRPLLNRNPIFQPASDLVAASKPFTSRRRRRLRLQTLY